MKKLLLIAGLLTLSLAAVAQEAIAPSNFKETLSLAGVDSIHWKYAAYFIGVAIAAYGGTQGQSRAAAVALEGIARNPSAADKLQTPMILALALMESLVIFTLITIFLV